MDLVQGGSVIVNAGAGGAGRVIAESFADRGARVAVCDIDPAAVEAMKVARPDILAITTDATDEQAVSTFYVAAEERNGAVDVLVNNVGIAGPTAGVETIELRDWERTLSANLTSHFLFIRRAVPAMKKRGRGLIVNISSGSARTGLPLRLPYVVSKGAVLSMTMTLARELGPSGIRVNAILPGAIRGERIQRVIDSKAEALGMSSSEYERTLLRYISLRTMVEPEDIAAMALFLASGEGSRISGQMIGVDGNCEYEE